MVNFKGVAFVLLLIALSAACDNPTAPSPVTPVQPTTPTWTDIIVTVVDEETNDGLPGATVICVNGCGASQASATTNNDGQVTLRGRLPLQVRVEKEGYVPRETEVARDGDIIVLSSALSDITITVTLPYFDGSSEMVFPGLPGASVTCLLGCEGQPTKPTNNNGLVSFRGTNPITARLEKSGHVSRELRVSDGDRVFLGHEWPAESAKSFRMLRVSKDTILNWGVEGRAGSNFGCTSNTGSVPVITVVGQRGRQPMLTVLEHELFHGHQYEYGADRGPSADKCNLKPWRNSEEGRAWETAQNADRGAGRRVRVLDDYVDTIRPARKGTEGSAEFWAWWRRAESVHRDQVRNLCTIATSRCALMEQWFGPRPTSYP